MTTAPTPAALTGPVHDRLAKAGWSQLRIAAFTLLLAVFLRTYGDQAESAAWIVGGGALLHVVGFVFGGGKLHTWSGWVAVLAVMVGVGVLWGDAASHSALIGWLLFDAGLCFVSGVQLVAYPEHALAEYARRAAKKRTRA